MNPSYPRFQIVEFQGNNRVAGRNCGSNVYLGDVFTRIVKQVFHRTALDAEPEMTETVLVDAE